MTECPACHKNFNDTFKRYVWGSTTNTAKFVVGIGLPVGLSLLSAPLGKMLSNGAGRLGEEIAKELGCAPDANLNGWDHKCPFCGHR